MSDRRRSDADALDIIARQYLGEMGYENPADALESISNLVSETGRVVEGWDDE